MYSFTSTADNGDAHHLLDYSLQHENRKGFNEQSVENFLKCF
jgi:hypothetical protein